MQDKDMLIKRLNRIEGQVKGIQKMVDEERYCIDILTQISAIRSAINKVGSIILENHIKGCVVNSIKEDNSEESIEELMKTIDKFISNNNHLYVVEFNNKIIGCATLHLQQKLIRDGAIAGFIEEVAIHSDYRGHNIGSMLIQHLINESKKFNCYKVVLTCFPERENFYLKNGFYNESINMRYNPEY